MAECIAQSGIRQELTFLVLHAFGDDDGAVAVLLDRLFHARTKRFFIEGDFRE
jgi:hypothetical protein